VSYSLLENPQNIPSETPKIFKNQNKNLIKLENSQLDLLANMLLLFGSSVLLLLTLLTTTKQAEKIEKLVTFQGFLFYFLRTDSCGQN